MSGMPSRLPSLAVHELPLVVATPESLQGYGAIVADYESTKVEIVRWPAQGWRPVDPDTGDEGGTVEGIFGRSGWELKKKPVEKK